MRTVLIMIVIIWSVSRCAPATHDLSGAIKQLHNAEIHHHIIIILNDCLTSVVRSFDTHRSSAMCAIFISNRCDGDWNSEIILKYILHYIGVKYWNVRYCNDFDTSRATWVVVCIKNKYNTVLNLCSAISHRYRDTAIVHCVSRARGDSRFSRQYYISLCLTYICDDWQYLVFDKF